MHRRQLRGRWLVVGIAMAGALALWFWRESRDPRGLFSTLAGQAAHFPRHPELQHVRTRIFALDATVADYADAEQRVKQVLATEPRNVEAAIVAAEVNNWYFLRGFDRSEEHYWEMQRTARRAIERAPNHPDALAAMGEFLLARTADLPRAAEMLRRAIAVNPHVPRWHSSLAEVLRINDPPAGLRVLETAATRFPQDVLTSYNLARHYRDAGDADGFERALENTLALYPLANALLWKARVQLWRYGDLAAMKATLDLVPEPLLLSERAAMNLFVHAHLTQQPAAALTVLQQLPNDWFEDHDYVGPKGLLVGGLLELQGDAETARREYQQAYAVVARRKPRNRADPSLRVGELWTLIALGRHAEARAAQQVYTSSLPRPYRLGFFTSWWFSEIPAALTLGDREGALELMREAAETAEGLRQMQLAFRIDPRMARWGEDPEFRSILAAP